MSAPVVIGEPCGCLRIQAPDVTAEQYLYEMSPDDRDALARWLDAHVEEWRDDAISALAHGDGVLVMQRHISGRHGLVVHDQHTDDAHIAQLVLTLNTERPPIPE